MGKQHWKLRSTTEHKSNKLENTTKKGEKLAK